MGPQSLAQWSSPKQILGAASSSEWPLPAETWTCQQMKLEIVFLMLTVLNAAHCTCPLMTAMG